MNQLQTNLFKLLKEFDAICKKENVQYYLAGGTALGAVRNHCFLPWDDDIDLYITRDNWNKLRKAVENDNTIIPEGRALIYKENTEYYDNLIPRYLDLTTTSIVRSQILSAKSLGQHIELLIMDPMPVDMEKIENHIDMLKTYTELVSPYFVVNKNLSISDFEKHYQIYDEYYNKAKKKGQKAVIEEMEDEILQYPEDKCEEFCMRWGIDILRYKKKYYGTSRLEHFESELFPVGEIAEGIFRVAYGDSWMYIPNVENQVVHNAIRDFETPFKKYTDIYEPLIDKDEYYYAFQKNKRNNMERYIHRLKIDEASAKVKGIILQKELDKSSSYDKSLIEELINSKQHVELNNIFFELNKILLDKKIIKFGIHIDVDQEILYYDAMNYIMQGQYYVANKLLKNKNITDDANELINKARDLIGICRALSIAIYDEKDIAKVKHIISELDNEQLQLLDVCRAKLWVLKQENKWHELQKQSSEAVDLFPFDGEVLAYKGLAEYHLGNKAEAKKIYEKAVWMTRNAFVWDDAKMLFGIDRITVAE